MYNSPAFRDWEQWEHVVRELYTVDSVCRKGPCPLEEGNRKDEKTGVSWLQSLKGDN